MTYSHAHVPTYDTFDVLFDHAHYHTIIVDRPNKEQKSRLFRCYCSRVSFFELQGL